jgi:DNA-binding transcriptional ArsR family regulator
MYMQNLIEIFKALSDETRLRILNLLYEGELCVCDVMAVLDISQPNASRHLIRLKWAGLARDRREAQWSYYALTSNWEKSFVGEIVIKQLREDNRCLEDLKLLQNWLAKKERDCCRANIKEETT